MSALGTYRASGKTNFGQEGNFTHNQLKIFKRCMLKKIKDSN